MGGLDEVNVDEASPGNTMNAELPLKCLPVV